MENKENERDDELPGGIVPEGDLSEQNEAEDVELDPDIDRFIELYASFGIPLKKQRKDGMYRVMLTDVDSEKFRFTPGAGSVVWFELDGTFAKQIFYDK